MFEQMLNTFLGEQGLLFHNPLLVILLGGVIPAAWSVATDALTYWAARLGGRPAIERLSRWLRIDLRHMERTEVMFGRWGKKLVLFGRIFPGVRTLVSIPAGMTHMHFGVFLGMSISGAYLWNTILVAVSYLLGFKWALMGIAQI